MPNIESSNLYMQLLIIEKQKMRMHLDLKDAYFSISLIPGSRKFVQFLWSGKLYEVLRLCFGLGSALRTCAKLPKIPVSVLRHLNILMIIYLDNMLLIVDTIKET